MAEPDCAEKKHFDLTVGGTGVDIGQIPPAPVVHGRPNFVDKTIWTGDNLDILRGMNSECVDIIYLDPPFNRQLQLGPCRSDPRSE